MKKWCTKCKSSVLIDGFYRNRSRSDGLTNCCKRCCKQYSRDYNSANPEKLRARSKRFRLCNPEKVSKWNRSWYLKNADKQNCKSKKWAKDHPDRCRSIARALYKESPAKYRQWSADWQKDNPEKVANYARIRRARKQNVVVEPVTTKDWRDILDLWYYHCAYCLMPQELLPSTLTMDHVIPLCRGGVHSKDNLVPACLHCNCAKGKKLVSEWVPQVVAT